MEEKQLYGEPLPYDIDDVVYREKIEEAVEAAWKSIRPDLGKIGVCNI